MTKQTHEWVFARNLEKNDQIEVAGQECTIIKIEDIFHYVPKANVRLTLQTTVQDKSKVRTRMILFVPEGMTVKRELRK